MLGYLISDYDDMSGSYTCTRLIEEFRLRGIRLVPVGVYDTYYSDGILINRGKELAHADFAINRFKWGMLKDEICALCGRSYNDIGAFDIYVNKYEQVSRLKSDLYGIPDSVLAHADADYGELCNRLGTPFVAKGLEDSRGSEIFLIRDANGLSRLADFGYDKQWLFQRFVSESEGRDLRLFCTRGKAVASMVRTNDRDFRSNYALGAGLQRHEITDELENIASFLYRRTGLDVIGADLLFGEDGFMLCEINVMPGLKGIESVSGLNIAGMIAEIAENDMNGQG